jgi:hypothetical protein
MTTTTTMPAVIDGLLSLFRGLTAVTGDKQVQVFDGLPGPNVPEKFIQIGGVDPITADGTQDWMSLGVASGAPARDENYIINCYVSCYVGGTDATTAASSDAQKVARDNAFTLVAAMEAGLRADPVLATTLGSPFAATGWISWGGRVQLEQTTLDSLDAELGRRAVVSIEIGVFARLYS